MRKIAVAAFLAILAGSAGCLANPDNFPQNNSPNSSSNNATNSSTSSSTNGENALTGTNNAGECANCAVEETQCEDGGFYECTPQSVDGEQGGCNIWTLAESCTGARVCDDDDGCRCTTDCDLDGEVDCQANGAFVCAVVDECPRLIQIDRTSDCSAPDHGDLDCEENPDDPLCSACADGRECVKVCETGDFYACSGGL